MRRLIVLAASMVLLVVVTSAAPRAAGQAEGRWVITDLGTLGGRRSEPVAINERGQIVGYSTTKDRSVHAFLWEKGKLRDLGTLGGEDSFAEDINDRGQIVGSADTKRGVGRAFLWENGKMRDLGTLGGQDSWAHAINDRGQVVGFAATRAKTKDASGRSDPVFHAFLWENGKMRDLGTPRAQGSSALGINERSQVVGWRDDAKADRIGAFLWENGKLRDLDTMFGVGNVGCDLAGSCLGVINDRGQVVGLTDLLSSPAVLWENGTLRDLGTLGGKESVAEAINELGQVVGVFGDRGERRGRRADHARRFCGRTGRCGTSGRSVGHAVGRPRTPSTIGVRSSVAQRPSRLAGWGCGSTTPSSGRTGRCAISAR